MEKKVWCNNSYNTAEWTSPESDNRIRACIRVSAVPECKEHITDGANARVQNLNLQYIHSTLTYKVSSHFIWPNSFLIWIIASIFVNAILGRSLLNCGRFRGSEIKNFNKRKKQKQRSLQYRSTETKSQPKVKHHLTGLWLRIRTSSWIGTSSPRH